MAEEEEEEEDRVERACGDTLTSTSTSHGEGDGPGRPPFDGLIICVSGLSKEARKQVSEATERLGGTYSPTLHPHCTHLLLQISFFGGQKLEHALKHGLTNGLFLVTLGWFVHSVRRNVRLNELPYSIHSIAKLGIRMEDWFVNSPAAHDSCLTLGLKLPCKQSQEIEVRKRREFERKLQVNKQSHLAGHSIYIDSDVSAELRSKVLDVVAQEGAVLVNQWFVGCGASYVVCEGSSIQIYLGHCNYIVSPIWILKTSIERAAQRFIGLSADVAREIGVMLDSLRYITLGQKTNKEKCHEHIFGYDRSRVSQAERLQIVNLAKCGIRNRRARRLQVCEVPLRPINPNMLLDSICWSISEPTFKATVFADSLSCKVDYEIQKHMLSSERGRLESEVPVLSLLRPLTESERNELVFRNHFLTILFPVDRFAEMGPSSRTYFSDTGFTCLQLLDFIYDFYQESMSNHEIEAAIHSDSRHAEQLRSMYCSERMELGFLMYKRIEFLGSRRSFEMLKRVPGDNNSNLYELLIRE